MRPLRLEVTALGPYAGTQLFDFAELAGRSFFLIHGPTGAGKTSVLDALCFALYGDASGSSRDGRGLRSDYASSEVRTTVTLDFALGGATYRVTRSPSWDRPKKRGGGTTEEKAAATLWRLDAESELATGDSKVSEPHVLATGDTKVSESVAQLLGFESDQFRQVVVLPQGEFRRFLLAEVGEREKILEALFKTQRFVRVEWALKDAARDLVGRRKIAEQARSIRLDEVGAADVAALDLKRVAATDAVREAVGALDVARRADELARAALEAGKRAQRALDERAAAESALLAIEEKAPAVATSRARLDAGQRAASLGAEASSHDARAREAAAADEAVLAAETALRSAGDALLAARARFTAEQKRDGEREAAQAEELRLAALAPKAAGLSAAAQEAALAARAHELAAQQLAETLRTLGAIEKTLELRVEEEAQARTAASELDAREKAVALAAERLDQRQKIEVARIAFRRAKDASDEAKKRVTGAEKLRAKSRTRLAELEKLWQEGQAFLLAKELEKGAPCPVCGSVEHPNKQTARTEPPPHERLEEVRREIEVRTREIEDAQAAVQAFEKDRAQAEGQGKELGEQLGPLAKVDQTLLAEQLGAAKNLVKASETARVRLQDLLRAVQETRARREQLVALRADHEEATRVAAAEAAAAKARLAEREAEVPLSLRVGDALERAIRAAAERRLALTRALEEAREAQSRAERSEADAAARAGAAQAAALAAATARDAAARAVDAALAAAGFVDREAWRAAMLDASALTRLDEEVRAYETTRAAAVDRATRARGEAAPFAASDLVALEAAARDADSARELATSKRQERSDAQALLDRAAAQLDNLAREHAELEARFAVVGRLAEVADGNNAFKIGFQRYVLGTLLDDVLVTSTQRLREMSRGRYELQRRAGAEGRERKGGLALEVMDHHTGIARPVGTLSGGESFLASLCLALGLADVLQSYAGGVRLDTIFVDEGFGTLDPEALDLAIDTLVRLQEGGRLVGVISHVPELRERVDARLEVVRGIRGSTARFVVG